MSPALILQLVRIRETVFGLTWAVAGAFLAIVYSGGVPVGPFKWLLIGLGFVFARTAGMCFNRVIDRQIDAANPRTQHRMVASGEVEAWRVTLMAWVSTGLFVLVCALLNPVCLKLSPVAIALLYGYSYTKRFTNFSHFVLGCVQAFAPIFAWVAVTGELTWAPVSLGLAYCFSIAGMDMIYSLQDHDFDVDAGLHSMAVALGKRGAVMASRACHAIVVMLLIVVGYRLQLGLPWHLGISAVTGVYLWHHQLIDIKHPDQVAGPFFACNAYVGLIVMTMSMGAALWHVTS